MVDVEFWIRSCRGNCIALDGLQRRGEVCVAVIGEADRSLRELDIGTMEVPLNGVAAVGKIAN